MTDATSTPISVVVRAGEAAWRTGLAHDAAGMLAIVTARCPAALVDDLREDIDLGAFDGGPAELTFSGLTVVERGAELS